MIIIPSGGVNEREPTTIGDDQLQDCTGAEYRVGEQGVFVARGRERVGTLGATGKGLYEAGFDGSPGYLIGHNGDTLQAAQIGPSLSFTTVDTLATGSSAIVGAHYANRHYLATGTGNRRIENTGSGVTSYPIGMSASVLGITATVAVLGGSSTATFGLVYWVTEYDSVRGIESVTGSSCLTAAFTNKRWIQVVATGVTTNPTADTLRWYRSVDGGGYPDGGLVGETPIGTTVFNDGGPLQLPSGLLDNMAPTSSLTVPSYGLISIGGLDTERDAAPPTLSTLFGPFQDSLIGVAVDEPRVLRFTPAGYPDSWPSGYVMPLESSRRDEIVCGIAMPSRVGLFCTDSVHVVYRLPRDSDSVYAAGEMIDIVTLDRGCVSRRGATIFSPGWVAFVARDGIFATQLIEGSEVPLTDQIDWTGRVSVADLSSCRLQNDPLNRRLVFTYKRATDGAYQTGVWYLDYQQFAQRGVRITFADHGPLIDAVTIAASDGLRRLASLDSRASNGAVYLEASQDVDDSQLLDSSGSVDFRIRTKEYVPGGAGKSVALGTATWMHDAMPENAVHRFYHNRRDANPDVKAIPNSSTRNGSQVILPKSVNSYSLEVETVGTQSYGIHWLDVEELDAQDRGGRDGV